MVLLSFGFLLLLGCGKHGTGGTVSGTLQYKGQAVNGATLHFYPVPGPGPDFAVPVSQDGTFHTSQVPAGEYKVVVQPSKAPPGGRTPNIPADMDPAQAADLREKFKKAYPEQAPTIPFPDKYMDEDTTNLKCTIQDGEQKLPLQLED
jgi:hypothetical protein